MGTTKTYKRGVKGELFPYLGKWPDIADDAFIASGAKIIGDVTIGAGSSVWYNTVVRGDVHYIKIGERSNVQDLSMLHVTNNTHPLNIGDDVTIGHAVKLHGCTLKNRCFIGIGAIILDGAVIEEDAMVAAGALIPPGKVVKSGTLVAGIPAKELRKLTEGEIESFKKSAQRYANYSVLTLNSLDNPDFTG